MDSDYYADGVQVEDEYDYGGYQDYDYQAEEMEFKDDGLTLKETIDLCVVPTTNDAIGHIGKLMFWCFILRIIVTVCKYF